MQLDASYANVIQLDHNDHNIPAPPKRMVDRQLTNKEKKNIETKIRNTTKEKQRIANPTHWNEHWLNIFFLVRSKTVANQQIIDFMMMTITTSDS